MAADESSADPLTARGRVPVVVEARDGGVAVVRLDRPAERNPLSTTVLETLTETVATLEARASVRAVVFTGAGAVFASGADIRELSALDAAAARGFADAGQRLMRRVAGSPLLTIAAVNGYCMGGGLDLALSCRARVASHAAVFAHPGARLGIITGWGGTQRLPRLVGPARALEMLLTARRVSAREALEMGLVSRLSEDALDCALELAASVH